MHLEYSFVKIHLQNAGDMHSCECLLQGVAKKVVRKSFSLFSQQLFGILI